MLCALRLQMLHAQAAHAAQTGGRQENLRGFSTACLDRDLRIERADQRTVTDSGEQDVP
jgi:hypothetical protein